MNEPKNVLDTDVLLYHTSLLPNGLLPDNAVGDVPETPPEESKDESMDLQHAINVIVRFRPPSKEEKQLNQEGVRYTSEGMVKMITSEHHFEFDRVFGPQTSQDTMFEAIGPRIVQHVMDGLSCSILSYGQCGSGKTTTMLGGAFHRPERPDISAGIIPRMFPLLMGAIHQAQETNRHLVYTVTASFIELHKDIINDLLSQERPSPVHKMRMYKDPLRSGVSMPTVITVPIETANDLHGILEVGCRNRNVAKMQGSASSSRSHALMLITVQCDNLITESRQYTNLYLADLAGSTLMRNFAEDPRRQQAYSNRLQEARYNNFSLSGLGQVLKAISSESKYVPFRNTKLTQLLADSLQGSSKCVLLVSASMSELYADETLATMRFAESARLMKHVLQEEIPPSKHELKALVKVARAEIKRLDVMLSEFHTEVAIMKQVNAFNQYYYPERMESAARTVESLEWDGDMASLENKWADKPQRPTITRVGKLLPTEDTRKLLRFVRCPLSNMLMTHPVVAADGYTYQRVAIENWMKTSTRSPVTDEIMPKHVLISSVSMKRQVHRYFGKYAKSRKPFFISEIQCLPSQVLRKIFYLAGSVDTLALVCADWYFLLVKDGICL